MKTKIETIIKLIISALLLGCLFNMPYGYYEFMRIVCITGFAVLAYKSHQKENTKFTIIYCGLIILFQPFSKIYLGREIWQIVDIIVASGLLLTLFWRKKGVKN